MILLLAAAAVTVSPDDLADRYRAMTAAEHRCVIDRDETTVTVCGLRDADRFRVPFVVGPARGSREDQNVPLERETLLYRRTPVQDMGPFLVGGGFAGVTVGTRQGLRPGQPRPLAP